MCGGRQAINGRLWATVDDACSGIMEVQIAVDPDACPYPLVSGAHSDNRERCLSFHGLGHGRSSFIMGGITGCVNQQGSGWILHDGSPEPAKAVFPIFRVFNRLTVVILTGPTDIEWLFPRSSLLRLRKSNCPFGSLQGSATTISVIGKCFK